MSIFSPLDLERILTRTISSAVVVVCFFVCWAPFHTQRLLYVLQHHRSAAVIRDDISPTQLQKCI